ncbi:MAG: thiol reductant ABC exporter subunit CydC [Solirubrobacteraceae bacterium]
MSAQRIQWLALRRVARLAPGERPRLSLSVLLGAAAVLSGVGLLTTSGYLISRAAQRPPIVELTAVVTAVQGFGIARALTRYGERLVSHDLALRILTRLRASFYAAVSPLGRAALGGHRQGDLLARFVADVDSLQDLYLRALAPPLVAAIVVGVAAVTAGVMLPAAGLVVLVALIVSAVVVPALSAAAAAAAGRRQAAARAELTGELVETLEGSVELAVAGRAAERVQRLDAASSRLTRLSLRDALAGAGATTLSALFTGSTLLVVLLVAIPAAHDGRLGVVYLAALAMLVLGAFEGVAPLPMAARRLRTCATAAARLQELERLRQPVCEPLVPCPLPRGVALSLTVSHVNFGYEPEVPLLRDLSLSFAPGCRVALTGPSGVGKSTLAQLLVRFIDPDAGSILLGGVDLRELTLDDVRQSVVLIEQDAHVFNSTLRENLLLARRDASEAELFAALTAVRLGPWVRSLPDGLDTLTGEDGEALSGGQRQRLTIARALISDARFMVLDEPTAHLDRDTAAALIANVSAAAGDRGLIVITHRVADVAGFAVVSLS